MKKIFGPFLLALLSCGSGSSFAYCANDEFLTTPSPNVEEAQRPPTVTANSGKINSIEIDGKRFRVIRSEKGTIIGIADEAGKVSPIAEINDMSTGTRGGATNVLDPCQVGGDSVVLDVPQLPPVEVTRERAGDTYFWKDITQMVYPTVPEVVALGPDPDRVAACKPSFDSCMARASQDLPLFLPACLKASDFIKVKRPGWGAVIYAGLLAACGAAAEWMRDQNENRCRESFASCSAGG